MTHTRSQAGSGEFIALMAVMMSLVAISIDAMLPALGLMGQDLGLSDPNRTQFVITAIFTGMALGQLVCGPLSDALGRKPIIYITVVVYLIGTVVCLMSQTIEIMLLGRFLQGLGVSGPYVSTMSIVRDRYSGSAMGRIMSLVMMIFIMVPAIAPSLGVATMTFGTWRHIFGLYLFYAIAVIVWVTLRLTETLPPDRRISFSLAHIASGAAAVFSNRRTVCYMVAIALIFGGMTGYLNSSRQIFQDHYAVGDAFALYFGGLALTFGASSLGNSRIVERLGMQRIVAGALLAIAILSAAFFALNLIQPAGLWLFVVYLAGIFFCLGFLFGNLNALAMEPMGHVAGIASAIIGSTSSVIALCLGTFIGQLYDNSVMPVTAGFLILGVLAFGLVTLAGRVR